MKVLLIVYTYALSHAPHIRKEFEMDVTKILQEVRENLEAVIAHDTPLGSSLWEAFMSLHPADIADFLTDLSKDQFQRLFTALPRDVMIEVFEELSDSNKAYLLPFMSDHEASQALHALSPDELTDLFDQLSDEELKKYMGFLHKNVREQVVSLLKFDPDSAGGIMTTDVLTLMEDFTVEQSVKLIQRLRPRKDIHQEIFITNRGHQLVGNISLEDLLLHHPKENIREFMGKNELIVHAGQDQEEVAKLMIHYGLMIAPVTDDKNHFLGVIPSETLVDVLVEEASEDVHKMATLPAMEFPYFEMSFIRLLSQRCYVLVALLVAELFNGNILRSYESILTAGILYSFVTIITSAGGNSGSQTSAVVIQGMASGEINYANMFRFLRREMLVSGSIAILLGFLTFGRAYWISTNLGESSAVGISLSLIVLTSSMLGATIPFVLRRLRIDPAFSAGPLLATLMDVLGIALFCFISKLILG